MQIIADFHIHSHFSRATSKDMSIEEISRNGKLKGLQLVGTGDFTHPSWLEEIREKLGPNETHAGSGIFVHYGMLWMLTGEVATIYTQDGKTRKVHHVLHAPSLEVVEQINEALKKYGKLAADGRPMLSGLTSPALVETLVQISKDILIYPAHAWTSWFGVLGEFSGFDSLEECYQDRTKDVHALETGMSCYDPETEVLTDNGWKKIPDVKNTDEICTLDVETGKIEFQKPVELYKYRYKGRMYKLKTRRVDLLVTPNHKLLYSPCDFRKPPKFSLKEAELLFGKSKRFKKDGIWVGDNPEYFVIPTVRIKHGSRHYSGRRTKEGKRVPTKQWLKFFGFWVAEGWTTKGKDGDYGIYIANSDSSMISEMKTILESFGYSVYKYKNRGLDVIRVRDYQLFSYLRRFGKAAQKHIPEDVKSLSKPLLEIFFDYYIKGDGHKYGRTGKGLSASTISKLLRDDLQEIALKIGISAYYKLHREKGTPITSLPKAKLKDYRQSQDSWNVYFIRKNIHAVMPSVLKKHNYTEAWIEYDGFVYCLEVKNHTIYVRRNGIPVWCGNSDPAMNWRVSGLDRVTILSNSDSHSPWPWRIGREANVFELDEGKLTYAEINDAILKKDPSRLKFTIEVDPSYGKYHFTGHRACGVSFSPEEAKKLNNICPVCKRKLTIGVAQRVEEVAGRPAGFVPSGAIPFKSIIPLYEIISAALGVNQLYSKRVIEQQDALIARFGNELNVVLNVPETELQSAVDGKIADAIIRVRNGDVKYVPGYDGVYGIPVFSEEEYERLKEKQESKVKVQRSLSDFRTAAE